MNRIILLWANGSCASSVYSFIVLGDIEASKNPLPMFFIDHLKGIIIIIKQKKRLRYGSRFSLVYGLPSCS